MILTPQEVIDIKEYAETESDNSEMLLNLIDTIAYLAEEVQKSNIYPCEYKARDVSKCNSKKCLNVECPLYK